MSDAAAVAAPAPPAPAPFDMPPITASFEKRGGWVVNRLVADLAITPVNAASIVGNLGGESGLQAVQERRPISGRGGFGWAQWTAARRVAFEHWCADHDLSTTSDEANYRFLVEELRGSEKHALEQLQKTISIKAGVFTFEFFFERPADLYSQLEDRIAFAQRALNGAAGLTAGAPAQVPAHALPPEPDPDNSADALNAAELAEITGRAAPVATPPSSPEPAKQSRPPLLLKPTHATIAATSLSAAVVGTFVWLLQLTGIAVPQDVQGYWIIIAGSVGAWWLHRTPAPSSR